MIVKFLYHDPSSFVLNTEVKNIDFVPQVGNYIKIKNIKYKVSSVTYCLDVNYFSVKLEHSHDLSSNS